MNVFAWRGLLQGMSGVPIIFAWSITERSAMSLPHHYLITPKMDDEEQFIGALEQSLQAGTRLMQLRGKGLDESAYRALAGRVIPLAHRYGCRVLLSTTPALVTELGADGLHLDSKALLTAGSERLLPQEFLLAVSAHDLQGVKKGEVMDADFGVLSPINYTSAHPDMAPLGWAGLQAMTQQTTLPLYALGGVSAEDEEQAIAAGALGVAGSRGYWQK